MSARSTNYMQAIEHLPAGALLVFQSVGWEEYEQVLEDLVDRPGIRATYDRGRLEIMSPLREHEALKEFVLSLVRILAEELDVDLESCGSTTFKKKEEAKGTEPRTLASMSQTQGGSLESAQPIFMWTHHPTSSLRLT